MKGKAKFNLLFGGMLILIFIIWTCLIKIVDVKPLGINGTDIGFSAINLYFHKLCGIHMSIYTITDWAGLIPLFIAISFGGFGFIQLLKRKSIIKVDADILILGIYYIIVLLVYLLFETIHINYRPILIDGFMEKSYPSSTTLLTMTIMPTFIEQFLRRCKNKSLKFLIGSLSIAFLIFMVGGRLISGVHWLSDIIGAMFFSMGLFFIYKGFILIFSKKENF